MKVHPPLQKAVISAWQDVFVSGRPPDMVLEKAFKSNRQFGARDRRFIAENFYDGVRSFRGLIVATGGVWSDQTSEVAKGLDWQKLFDELIRKKSDAKADTWFSELKDLKDQVSVPDWLADRVRKELGQKDADTFFTASHEMAPVFVRTNTLKMTREQVLSELSAEGIPAIAKKDLPDCIEILERKNVFRSKTFLKGGFEVQDGGSQQIAPLLDLKPGLRVVDACAGAGGKSLHIAALMKNKGKVLSLDIYESKLKQLRTRASRAGADTIETRWIENEKVIKRLEGTADRLLLDVPCSGLGVLRRHPETKWRLTPEDLAKGQELQTKILSEYSKILKPSGILVYATCSILPSENEEQVQQFLKSNSNFKLEKELKISSTNTDYDGFYAAQLIKSS